MKSLKSLICFVLATIMCFSVACSADKSVDKDANDENNEESSVVESDESEKSDAKIEFSESTNSENSNESNNNDENINVSDSENSDEDEIKNIRYYLENADENPVLRGSFSYGYCFAQIRESPKTVRIKKTVCFDKHGDIVFELEGNYYISQLFNKSGLALIGDNYGNMYICDTTGKLTTAGDLGGTSFYTEEKIWEKGYIIVEKIIADYTGTKHYMAIFNGQLEKIVDYSEKIYNYFEESGRTGVYGNYVYGSQSGSWLNLDDGSITITKSVEEYKAFYSTSFSDTERTMLWWYDGNVIAYIGSDEIIFDVTKVYPTCIGISDFVNGFAYIIFESERQCYFSVMNKDFELQFEPVEYKSQYFRYDGGEYYCLYNIVSEASGQKTIVNIYDNYGLVSQHEFLEHGDVYLYDDIIGFKGEYYDIEFNKLF